MLLIVDHALSVRSDSYLRQCHLSIAQWRPKVSCMSTSCIRSERSLEPTDQLPCPRFLTTIQGAAYLGLSHKTLEGYRLKRQGPDFLKIGRLVRYRTADLDRWAESFLMKGNLQ